MQDSTSSLGQASLEHPVASCRGNARRIVYCRVPGLLSEMGRHQAQRNELGTPLTSTIPFAVAEGRTIRDVCLCASRRGVRVGMPVVQARRICPMLIVVPLEDVQPGILATAFWDVLAELSPVVEPEGFDVAYADLTVAGMPMSLAAATDTDQWVGDLATRIAHAVFGANTDDATGACAARPVVGLGPTKLMARAVAESGLSPDRFADVSVRWLCPDDSKTIVRLHRLGLTTVGEVAAVGEGALEYQFGAKGGRLLYRRAAFGQDGSPVRAFYPALRADAQRDLSEDPVADTETLRAHLSAVAQDAAAQLVRLSRYGRHITLLAETESATGGKPVLLRRETKLPVPVQTAPDLLRAVLCLADRLDVRAPVTMLRLIVDDLQLPLARTSDLFGGPATERKQAVEATRRFLAARYGPKALQRMADLPVPTRDQRLALWASQA